MKSASLTIFGILLCHILADSVKAQSMAEKYLLEAFEPTANLQKQLTKQQTAHDKNKDIIFMATIYPDPKNILLTSGYFVTARGLFTLFRQGGEHGDEDGQYHLPSKAIEELKALLVQLPAPKYPNPEKRAVILSFLDGEKWVTRIYGGDEYHNILLAILRIPKQNDSGRGEDFRDYFLP